MEYPNHAPGMDLSPSEKADYMPLVGFGARAEMGNPDVGKPEMGEKPEIGGGCGCPSAPCGRGSWGLVRYPLAMVYAPCQTFGGLYDLETALNHGTLFAELDLPLEVGYATGKNCQEPKRRGCSC